MKFIDKYVRRRKIEDDGQREVMGSYLFQILMREGKTERAIMVNFDLSLQSYTPLGDILCNVPFDFSFVYGSDDWVRRVDQDYAKVPIASVNKSNC